MSEINSQLKVRFDALFKDGQLLHELVACGFQKSEVVPGAIPGGSVGTMGTRLYKRCEESGAEITVISESLIIPPSTRAEVEEVPEVEDDEQFGEPITLDDLDMSPHALKLARENELDAVALYDTFGDNPIMKGDIQAFVLSLSEK
jgi:hypothetical protein